MTEGSWEVYAIRYGHHSRLATENFLGGDPHDRLMPLDFFIWVLKRGDEVVVVDTGYDATTSARRNRELIRPVEDGLRALGVVPDRVRDVVITHMHYDHCGNHFLFPKARYHVQDKEMEYCTGRCMCHGPLRQAYEVEDVVAMVRRVFEGRVRFHADDGEIAPGVTVHRVGGHTLGLQVVRVQTRRGFVVLASDAAHLYANIEERRPFPSVLNVLDMLDAYDRVHDLATSPAHIIPGHDPLVLVKYPELSADQRGWIVRLDAEPRS